ncbi:MAG TPA: hypothetical protein VIU64_02285 [Polyangia bacterium]
MFRRAAAACALIAVAALAVGGPLPIEPRGSREDVATAVGAAAAGPTVTGSRRLSRRPSSDRIDSSDDHRTGKLGPFRWLWLSTAASGLSPPVTCPTLVDGTAFPFRFASPELATRSSRGPPARS